LEATDLTECRVQLHPEGSPSELASKAGWHVASHEHPVITINLATEDGKKPGLLEKIHITGNVKAVKVQLETFRHSDDITLTESEFIHKDGFSDFHGGKAIEVDHDGYIRFTNAESQSGVLVYKVRIMVVEPEDEHKSYAIKLQVHACVEGESLDAKHHHDSTKCATKPVTGDEALLNLESNPKNPPKQPALPPKKPVTPETKAPVVPETKAPLAPEIKAPLAPETKAPLAP